MTATPSVVIVGGGVGGLSTAANLVELGCCDVTVLEKNEIAEHSTGLSNGVYTRQYILPVDIEFRAYAYRRFEQLERDHGLHVMRNGYARLAHDSATVADFQTSLGIQQKLGIEDSKLLTSSELKDMIPDIEIEDIEAALYSPSDGHLDPHELCSVYAHIAEAAGARVLTRTSLLGVEPGSKKKHRLNTDAGDFECDVVVNAAGAWASSVGRLLGAPIEVVPTRHQVCTLTGAPDYEMPFTMDYIPGSGTPGLFFRSEEQGQLIAGLHTGEIVESEVADPDKYFSGIDPETIETVATMLAERLPSLDDMGLGRGWSGLYPMSPDDRPIVGPCPEDSSVVAICGLGGMGIMLSPPMSRIAAEWIVFGEPRTFAAAAQSLIPARFSTSIA